MIGPEIQQFKITPQTPLNIHIMRPDDAGSDKRYPGIVFFSCGGWRGMNASKFYPQSEYLVSRGIICLNAEVRVERHGTGPAECVIDAKSAIRWAREHADELGIDPNRLAAGGGSAAGMVTGCLGTIEGFNDPEDDPAVSALPDALIMFNPVCDMTSIQRRADLCGSEEQAKALSPTFNVKSGQPPFLVMHPKDDATVDVKQAIDFAETHKQAGNRCDLELWEEGGHGWFNYWDGNNPWFLESMETVDHFLVSLGWVTGEPSIRGFEFHHVPVDPDAPGVD